MLRRRRWTLILFAVLLFNPVNASDLSFERVYRCSVTNMQTLFLFGAVTGLYLDRSGRYRRLLARAVFSGVMLWAVWNTREDAMWQLPFVFVAGAVTFGIQVKEERSRKGIIRAAVLFIMPFALLLGGNAALCEVNRSVYGLPIRNEASAGFGEMIKTMYSIRNREEIDRVSISAEKLERMYAVSPTLQKIRPELTKLLEGADNSSDQVPGDGEVEDGWFFWCIRRAVEDSGVAPSLPEADSFYRQVNRELKDAIKDPANRFETQWVMPSPLMSPWRESYFGKIWDFTVRAAEYMIEYEEVNAKPKIVEPDVERMSYLFEGITGNASLHREEDMVRSYRKLYIDRANLIAAVYRFLNPAAAFVSMILFIAQAAGAVRRREKDDIRWLLVTAGFGLSILTLLVGVAYTEMTAFIAIRYTYMTGGHALMLAFEWIVILRALRRDGRKAGKREVEICQTPIQS